MPWDPPALEPELVTLPEFLKGLGYLTAFIGKWHLVFDWPLQGKTKPSGLKIGRVNSTARSEQFDWLNPITGGPLDHGFDTFFGLDCPNFPPFAYIEDRHIVSAETLVDIDPDSLPSFGVRGHIHGSGPGQPDFSFEKILPALTERAVKFTHEVASAHQPFFLLFSLTSPHTPVAPTREFQGTSKAGFYGDFIQQTDDAVGQLVTALEMSGMLENTILIFTSDNGPDSPHRQLIDALEHSPAGPLRGMKWEALEGGHRVPFIAVWPKGGISGGHMVTHLFSLTDLYHTLAAAMGTTLPSGAAPDSLDVVPTLRDNSPVRREMTHQTGSGKLALRRDNWVYIRDNVVKEPDWYLFKHGVHSPLGPPYLFNLADDRGQRHNFFQDYPEKVTELEARLAELTGPYFPDSTPPKP